MITSRLFALAVIFILMFAGLAGRLFDLQIVHGEEYMSQYESKILRTTYTNGTRGNIYDRDGNVLARNELAYAVTIHKSQGSEYPVVIIPCVKAFYTMLKRNILYTAITRAKCKVYLVGDWNAVCQ